MSKTSITSSTGQLQNYWPCDGTKTARVRVVDVLQPHQRDLLWHWAVVSDGSGRHPSSVTCQTLLLALWLKSKQEK